MGSWGRELRIDKLKEGRIKKRDYENGERARMHEQVKMCVRELYV